MNAINTKAPGTIGAFFDSLSGSDAASLPMRFAELKKRLVSNTEDETNLVAGWMRLLVELRENNPKWAEKGNTNIPVISYSGLIHGDNNSAAAKSVLECGSVIVKGAVSQETALAWKEAIREYIKRNPKAKGYPEHDPQVFDIFWSNSQLQARSHERILKLIVRMNELCTASSTTPISLRNPVLYADRCRERRPGDESFALGPHTDSGTIERWEDPNYSSVYRQIVTRWEDYDPWNIDGRVEANTDMYDSPGGSSVFRTFQGWLGLSNTGPGEGTLRVHPSIKHTTAYFWMRPFFTPIKSRQDAASKTEYLDADNWRLDLDSSSFPGSPPGRGQEFSEETHPHLELDITMTSISKVEPGDFVFWHCDGIHAVESKHSGEGDSSVIYIGAAPLTRLNAHYIAHQRSTFLEGFPPPDYPGGTGEATFVARGGETALMTDAGKRGMGLAKYEVDEDASDGEKLVIQQANEIFGLA